MSNLNTLTDNFTNSNNLKYVLIRPVKPIQYKHQHTFMFAFIIPYISILAQYNVIQKNMQEYSIVTKLNRGKEFNKILMASVDFVNSFFTFE